MSQDHIELLFGAIRSKGGFNNNSTARQFEAAYKRLLVKSSIRGANTDNVIEFGGINILATGAGTPTRSAEEDNLEQTEYFKNVEIEIKKIFQMFNFIILLCEI